MTKTVVIGLGNPVISDDALGPEVVRRLRKRLQQSSDFDMVEIHNGGFELMEAMAGYDRAIVIDAIVTGNPPGTIHRLQGADIGVSRNTATTHNGSLAVALDLGKLAGLHLPSDVRVWAVEAGDVENFYEGLTPEVESAVSLLIDNLLIELQPRTAQQQLDQRRRVA
jgi:hydrogenase maturation protease